MSYYFVNEISGKVKRSSSIADKTKSRKCDACHRKESILQRSAIGTNSRAVPTIVHDVLNSPGRSLDHATKSFFNPRFAYDFNAVRVHTDSEAAESARAVNARAYTVGKDIVFGANQYSPQTKDGKKLLAHELTHVLQQKNQEINFSDIDMQVGAADTFHERAAQDVSNRLDSGIFGPNLVVDSPLSFGAAVLQRQPSTPGGQAPITGLFNLTIDERGHVDLTVAGPSSTPVVSGPTIGIRRDSNGQYHLLVGGKDKVVAVEDIPKMLRQAAGIQTSGPRAKTKFKVPTCAQLTLHSGKEKGRFMSFEQYKIQQRLWHGQINPLGGETWLELTKPFYDALIDLCTMQQTPLPPAVEKAPNGRFPWTNIA